MAYTHARGSSYTVDGVSRASVAQTFVVNSSFGFSQSVPDGTVNLPFLVNFATDDLISCLISSNQPLTLKVNSTSAPTPTIAVAAGAPIEWCNVDLAANPFTTSPVTAIYINNASGSAATLEMAFAIDSD